MTVERSDYPWSDLQSTFLLRDVRAVATFSHDGGAIVELLEMLECIEGRRFAIGGECADRESAAFLLAYLFSFGVPNPPEPLAGRQAEARIVITGTHTNGRRVEIRGTGWIGYDSEGNLEGVFDEPPVMITEETKFPPPPESTEITEAEFQRRLNAEYPLPKQFEDALVRVPAPERDEDDYD